jgi:hypothetical protein
MTPREDSSILIAGVLIGRTLSQLAELTGLSVSTVQRRLKSDEVIAALQEARAHRHREVLGHLNRGVLPAVDQLNLHVGHEDPAVSLRAIEMLLRHAGRWATVVDVEERLAAVEAQLQPPPGEAGEA